MNKLILAVAGIVVVIIIGLIVVSNTSEQQGLQPGSSIISGPQELGRVPDFSLQDYNGQTVSLADFSGKTLVVNSWAAWCPFCRKELVDFVTVQKEFGDQVVFISIDRAESLKVAKKYTDELGVTDELVFLLDPSDSFYRSINGFSMPETIFVDRDGIIRIHKRGPMDVSEIREKVQSIL
ncbi:MAG: TlpA family protein disulfide reductase [Patescibacteria group bacterium]|nr:TlpA family protein disulfide reductase [Patescibacteria group bacterium]